MAALKFSHIVLLALLSFTLLCSASISPPSKTDVTDNVPVPTSSDQVSDTDRARKARILNTSSGGGGGGGGGGVVINNPIPGFGGFGSSGGYGSGSGSGRGGNGNGNVGSGGGGGGGGGWVGGIPSFGVPNPNFGVPNYGVPSSGGYGFGGGYGSGSGNGGSPPAWGGVNQPNQPYHCQPVNCASPYGCPGLTMHFTNPPTSPRGHYAMAPTPTRSGYAMAPTPSN